jgi:hypothetical protein
MASFYPQAIGKNGISCVAEQGAALPQRVRTPSEAEYMV